MSLENMKNKIKDGKILEPNMYTLRRIDKESML